jgi:hypothetical protein
MAADQKISALTSYTPPTTTDVLPIVDVSTSTTKKITIANLTAYLAALAETLTNKVFNLGSNTLTGTTAQFNTALSDGDFATLAGSEALTNKTYNGLTVTSTTGTITLTNSTVMTFPSTTATIARTDAGQTFTGTQVMTSPKILTSILDTNGNESITLVATGSAVNEVEITNAATGTAGPLIRPSGETNVDLKVAGKGTGKVHHTTGTYGDLTAYSPSAAGTATLTLNTANVHRITMPAGNITIALSNEAVGQCFVIDIIQDATGSRTVTWFTTIKWAGGVAPTLTTTANKIDTFGFIVTSAGNYQGYVVGQNL